MCHPSGLCSITIRKPERSRYAASASFRAIARASSHEIGRLVAVLGVVTALIRIPFLAFLRRETRITRQPSASSLRSRRVITIVRTDEAGNAQGIRRQFIESAGAACKPFRCWIGVRVKRRDENGANDQRRIAKVQRVLLSSWRSQHRDLSRSRILIDPPSLFVTIRGIAGQRIAPG